MAEDRHQGEGGFQRPTESSERSSGWPVETLLAAGLNVQQLPRVDNATPEDLKTAVIDERAPVVFSGLIDEWPARRTWTPENLVSMYGEKIVTALMDLPRDGVLFPREQKYYERRISLSDFVHEMSIAGPECPCYLAYKPAEEIFPTEDYDFDSLIPGDECAGDTRIWVGSAGTRACLHSDPRDNLFCQLYGEKSVIMISREDTSHAYPFRDNIANSRIDLGCLDLGRFPKVRDVTLYACTLQPGEALYLPRGCWHDVRSHTASISLNHWFGPRFTFKEYARTVIELGPEYWLTTARDFAVHGLFGRPEKTLFFFSPPSTGKRLYQMLIRSIGGSATNLQSSKFNFGGDNRR